LSGYIQNKSLVPDLELAILGTGGLRIGSPRGVVVDGAPGDLDIFRTTSVGRPLFITLGSKADIDQAAPIKLDL
jgi:hypothetical protein